MWSFSVMLSKNECLNLAAISSNQACGIPSWDEPVMITGRITLKLFFGYPSEDQYQFLYHSLCCLLYNLKNNRYRQSESRGFPSTGFGANLFCCLEDDKKGDWETLQDAFEIKYCVVNNPLVLLAESEQLKNLKLPPAHQIKD